VEVKCVAAAAAGAAAACSWRHARQQRPCLLVHDEGCGLSAVFGVFDVGLIALVQHEGSLGIIRHQIKIKMGHNLHSST
jgi:hypothetical protein